MDLFATFGRQMSSITDATLKGAGDAIKGAGFTIKEVRAANFSARECRAALWSLDELRAGGFTVEECKTAGYNVRECNRAGFAREREIGGASIAAADRTVNPPDIIAVRPLQVQGRDT